jgi:hypothetical protein
MPNPNPNHPWRNFVPRTGRTQYGGISRLTGDPSFPEKKKEELLSLAAAGMPRPATGSPLGNALQNYCTLGYPTCDWNFRKKLQALAPDWIPKKRVKRPRVSR